MIIDEIVIMNWAMIELEPNSNKRNAQRQTDSKNRNG